jgi:hypothetical protein
VIAIDYKYGSHRRKIVCCNSREFSALDRRLACRAKKRMVALKEFIDSYTGEPRKEHHIIVAI